MRRFILTMLMVTSTIIACLMEEAFGLVFLLMVCIVVRMSGASPIFVGTRKKEKER